MRLPSLAVVSCLLSLAPFINALSNSVGRPMVVHESRRDIPSQYSHEGSPHPETLVSLRIGLTSSNRDGLEKALFDVSVPGSPLYGKHLSMEEVRG